MPKKIKTKSLIHTTRPAIYIYEGREPYIVNTEPGDPTDEIRNQMLAVHQVIDECFPEAYKVEFTFERRRR